MKKYILPILIGIFFTINTYSQIGIMTESPATNVWVHVDAKSNNTSVGSGLNLDDMVVDKNGNVGLGTTSPNTKLHIVTGGTNATPNPQMRVEDGYQAENKAMMTDNNGLAKWSEYIPGYKAGTVGAAIAHVTTSTTWSKTNMSIMLDPGQWIIFYSISISTNVVAAPDPNYRIWIETLIGDNLNLLTPDALSKNRFANNGFIGKRSTINGWVAVNNATSAPKSYSIYVGDVQYAIAGLNLINVGLASDGSNLYAFRIKM